MMSHNANDKSRTGFRSIRVFGAGDAVAQHEYAIRPEQSISVAQMLTVLLSLYTRSLLHRHRSPINGVRAQPI